MSGRSCHPSACPRSSSMRQMTRGPVQGGRYLADHIDGARLLEVAGHDHAPFLSTDVDRISRTIEKFLTGSHAAPRQTRRALKTVLFSDIVSSTARAAAMGDERWSALLQRFGDVTSDIAERFEGTVVKSTGDGHLTTFERDLPMPSDARKRSEVAQSHWVLRSERASTPGSVS